MRRGLAIAVVVLAGCGAGVVRAPGAASSGAAALGDASQLTPEVGAALLAAQLASPAEVNALLHLRSEDGFELFAAPAVPGPGDRVLYVALLPRDFPLAALSTSAHFTADGWTTFHDVDGARFDVGGRPAALFDLGQAPAGSEVRATFRFYGPSFPKAVWLNDDGLDYRAEVRAPAALQWAGAARFDQDGLGRAVPAEPLFAGHDLAVHVETYPETPGVQALVHWTADGFATVHDAPMRVEAVHAGDTGHNTRWLGVVPTGSVAAGSQVTWWIELRGPVNTLWDSRGGQNYTALVAPAPQATWAEVGVYAFTKAHRMPDGSWQAGWFYGSGLPDPLSATPEDFQAYGWSPSPAVELYVPGITDRADAAALGQGGFVRVEAFSPFFSGDPAGDWVGQPLQFREVSGHNLRFAWELVNRSAPHLEALGAVCPVDGDYGFKLRLSTDGGRTWQWLGTDGLPSGGQNRTLHYQALREAPAMSTEGSTDFGAVPAGQSRTLRFDVVNGSGHIVQLTGASVEGAGLSASIPGCADLAHCARTLAPGARLPVVAVLRPEQAGPASGALHLAVSDTSDACYVTGRFDVALGGSGS